MTSIVSCILFMYDNITATRLREREVGEIIPVNVEQSATQNNFGAGFALDLDLDTVSKTVAGSDGTIWLKLTLDKVYCAEKVIRFYRDGTPYHTWTCTDTDRSNCVGDYCSDFTLTVNTEEDVSDLSPAPDCKYGDTVILEKDDGDKMVVYVNEIAIVEKPGNLDRNSMTELDKLSI